MHQPGAGACTIRVTTSPTVVQETAECTSPGQALACDPAGRGAERGGRVTSLKWPFFRSCVGDGQTRQGACRCHRVCDMVAPGHARPQAPQHRGPSTFRQAGAPRDAERTALLLPPV